ncbi:MAG: glycosyltransferase family 39 protein, partial [Chloroflexota bacterium]
MKRIGVVGWVRRHPLLLILLFALGLRLLLWSQPLHQPANDEVEYIAVAQDLLAGDGWVFYESYHWLRAPLYPLFLAGSLWLAGGDLHRAALPNMLLSVATIYLSYRLTVALFSRHAGLVAAAILAVLWTHATFASLYMAETLFVFLLTGGFLCLTLAY